MEHGLKDIDPAHRITDVSQLDGIYGQAKEGSLLKELEHISPHYRVFIEKSPFVIMSTVGPGGMDCSPRGDPPGFVRVLDAKTVLMPDRRGNNRLDSLRNLVADPRISLLFLVPGVGETLRINGRASIVTDPALCATFEVNGKPPASVLEITADRVYFQCQKALHRSKLWLAESQVERSELPSAGAMLKAVFKPGFDAETYDRDYPTQMKENMY